jgi:DNA uptake protein ComE-like DNA-binding protein
MIPLAAQISDPELADKLKSVMSLFDKNQKALKDEIDELNHSNAALTQANLQLFMDLKAAEKQIQALEAENLLLRSKTSEVAVRELESAALIPQRQEPFIDNHPIRERPTATKPSRAPQASDERPGNLNKSKININTATLEELKSLPLIDEAMAEQIILNRPYSSIEDLIINQGFGPMKLRRLTPLTTVESIQETENNPTESTTGPN